MTNLDKLHDDCMADLNLMVKEKLTRNCYINSLALNYISITFKSGWIGIHYNSAYKIELNKNNRVFDPSDVNEIEFYTAVKRFLTKNKFQNAFINRFLEYSNAGKEMISNRTYNKEYEEISNNRKNNRT